MNSQKESIKQDLEHLTDSEIDTIVTITNNFSKYKVIAKNNIDLRKENINLKQALNEIREYIAKDIQKCTYGQVPKYQDILQIINKVLGGNDDKSK